MKLFFTTLLLVVCLATTAQQINTIEYYFDTDPGYGNGTKIALNSATIDADFSFNIATLPAGIHSLYVRLKNSTNQWSILYQQNIFVSNGIAGNTVITAAEYFYDTDPGFGKGSQLQLDSASLNSDLSFNLPTMQAGSHTLYVRLKNNGNNWSTLYQSTVFVSAGNTAASTITTAEYFYDTDPGVGKATAVTLNSSSMDSNFKFSTTGLSAGLHTLFVRLKNNANAWSTTYSNKFSLYPGIDSLPKIISLDFFTDKDKGVGKNSSLALVPGASVDTTLSILIPDNGGDSSVLGLRLNNQAGQTGNVSLSTISLCNLYKPQGGFRSVRFGNSYSFVDSSLYNTSGKITWQVDNLTSKVVNSPVFNYTLPAGFNGSKNIIQITGTGCRRDTIYQQVASQSIEYISPHVGTYGNDFVLNIFGGDLDTTTTVYLQSGAYKVYPADKAIFAGKMLNMIFDFHNNPPDNYLTTVDYYDVHIHYAGGYDTVLTKAVTIYGKDFCDLVIGLNSDLFGIRLRDCIALEKNNYQSITADLGGPENIRAGIWTDYTLHLSNTGFNIAKEFPYWLMIPADNDVKFDLTIEIPEPYGNSVSIDSLPPLYTPIDTVIAGKRYQYKLYGFYFPYLSPGETRDINFKIRSTQAGKQQINYWVSKSMFGSPWAFNWFQCLWDGLGYVDIAGCATGTVDFFRSKGGFDASYKSNMSKGKLNEAFHASRTLGYSIAGVGLACAGLKHAAGATKLSQATVKRIAQFEGYADKFKSSIDNAGLAACYDLLANGGTKGKDLTTFFSDDPNAITGNNQYDSSKHFIDNYSPQHYTISFENKPTATAPAQHVVITDTLDRNKFNFNTFSFTGYRISDSSFMVPQYRQQIFQTTGLKNRNNLQVQFIGSFDTLSGIVRCDFYTMDSAGIQTIPATIIDGFLPPDADGVSGRGQVSYQVSAKNLGTQETFTNKATIVFDNNAPIQTNQWINTVDTTAPTGKIVNTVALSDTTVRLFVQHADIGSGFQYNSFFVKSQGDSMFRRIANTASDSVVFTGAKGLTYQFFTRATDNVGNIQQKDSVADITVVLGKALPLTLLSFTAVKEGTKVKLLWVTTNEINTAYFNAEKSLDGIAFNSIASVPANNQIAQTSTYTTFDLNPQNGYNYYRLKIHDLNGSFKYSSTARLYYGKNGSVSLAPNPAKNFIDIKTTGKVSLVIFTDASGKIVRQFTASASNRYPLNGLSKGICLIRVMIDNELQTFKLLIE